MVQVDERIAPAGDADRNLTHLRESLLPEAPLPEQQIYAMQLDSRMIGQGFPRPAPLETSLGLGVGLSLFEHIFWF